MSSGKSSSSQIEPQSAGVPLYMMYPPDQGHGVDLVALCKLIWGKKLLIAGVTFLFAAAGFTYAVVVQPVYRAECVLMPNTMDQSPSLAAGLGSLTSLAGINLGISPNTTDAVATLRSRVFVEEFISENKLMPILFADEWDAVNERWVGDDGDGSPDIRDGVRFFTEDIRTVDEDAATGLITLAVEWTDPQLAARWVEDLVSRINERLRARDLATSERRLAHLNDQLQKANLVELRQAISRLIESEIQTMTLARAETEYAFKVIDPPRVPIEPVAPRKLPILLFTALLGGLIGVSVALLLGWSRIAYRMHGTQEHG